MTGPRVDRRLIEPADGPAAELRSAVYHLARTAEAAKALDPLLTEAVRLRCAEYHDCRFCQSVRTRDAIDAGVDEHLAATVRDFEHSELDEPTKAALRLTDAVVVAPGNVDERAIASARAHLTDEQIAEVLFDAVRFSVQKTHVALRIEDVDWDGLREYWFDDAGALVLGDQVPGSRS